MTRNGATGENQIEGDYLINAQGEDVVAGIRADQADRAAAARDAGRRTAEFEAIARTARAPLPRHAGRRVHDRARQALDAADARRQAHGAGRGAHRRRDGGGGADHAASRRCCGSSPEQVDFFLHPQFDPAALRAAAAQRAIGWRRASTSRPAPRSARSRSTPTPPSAGRRRRGGGDHGAARDQAGRRARHARRAAAS